MLWPRASIWNYLSFICSYAAQRCDSESTFLPKQYVILLPCFSVECTFLFLRHWEIVPFLCIRTKKKEAIIPFYFFSVTLVAKLTLLVPPVDICFPVIYSQLKITLQELLSVFHMFDCNKAIIWQEHSTRNRAETGFRTFHIYCWLEMGLGKWGCTSLYCTLLYCALQTLHFLQSEVCSNSVSRNSTLPFFPEHFLTVSQFGNSHRISNLFYYYQICYGDLWGIIVKRLQFTKAEDGQPFLAMTYFQFRCVPTRASGFPGGAGEKEPTCQCRRQDRHGFSPGLGRSPGGGHGNHFSISAWRLPWMEWVCGLQLIVSQRVRHNWSGLTHIPSTLWYKHNFYTPTWKSKILGHGLLQYWWSGTERTLSPGVPAFILCLSPTAHQGLQYTEASPWEQQSRLLNRDCVSLRLCQWCLHTLNKPCTRWWDDSFRKHHDCGYRSH